MNTKFDVLVKNSTTSNEVLRSFATSECLVSNDYENVTIIGKEEFKVIFKENLVNGELKITPRQNFLCQLLIQLANKMPLIDNMAIYKAQKNAFCVLSDTIDGVSIKENTYLKPFTLNEIAFCVALLHTAYNLDFSIRNRNNIVTLKPFCWNEKQFNIVTLSAKEQARILNDREDKAKEISFYITSGMSAKDAQAKYRENHKKISSQLEWFADNAAQLEAATSKKD